GRHTRSKRDWSSDVCSSDLRSTGKREETDRGRNEWRGGGGPAAPGRPARPGADALSRERAAAGLAAAGADGRVARDVHRLPVRLGRLALALRHERRQRRSLRRSEELREGVG